MTEAVLSGHDRCLLLFFVNYGCVWCINCLTIRMMVWRHCKLLFDMVSHVDKTS
jgi:hypothetical protein